VDQEISGTEQVKACVYAPSLWCCSASEWKVSTTFIYGSEDWMNYQGAQEARKHMKVPCEIIRVPRVYLFSHFSWCIVIFNEIKYGFNLSNYGMLTCNPSKNILLFYENMSCMMTKRLK